MSRLGAVALLLAVLTAGCLQEVPPAAAQPCRSVPDCLLAPGDEPVRLVLHASAGLGSNPVALQAFTHEASLLTGRRMIPEDGAAPPALAPQSNESVLRDLHGPVADWTTLHLYVLNTTHLVGQEPASGLAFPGEPLLFLFPGALDHRVAQAALDEPAARQARTRLETLVLAHEFGHALGLVGCGLAMVQAHADADSPCHSSNRTSVMQAKVARVNQWPVPSGDGPLAPFGWDANDRADLAARRAALAR